MAVDYGAGASSAIASQYESLRKALADKGTAENLREARNIERKGLFGTGIRTSDIQDLTSAGLSVAEFGQKRMEGQMDRATKSFDRRTKADERRIATLKERAKGTAGDVYSGLMGEIQGIEMGMGERRNSYENTLGDYRKKGLWGTGFGSDEIGYRTEGESKYSKSMRPKGPVPPGAVPGDESDWSNLGDLGEGQRSGLPPMRDFERSDSPPDTAQKFRGGSDIGVGNEPFQRPPAGTDPSGRGRMTWENNPLNLPPEGRDPSGREPEFTTSNFPGREGFLGSNFGKKKDNLVNLGGSDPLESNKFDPDPELGLGESRIPRIGKNPARLPMSGALRDLTPLQRRRGDVLEKQKLITGKEQAISKQKLEEDQMIQDVVNKRRRQKLEDLVAGIDLN